MIKNNEARQKYIQVIFSPFSYKKQSNELIKFYSTA